MASQRSWVLLSTAAEERPAYPNDPYDDEPGSHYSYDDRVGNWKQLKVGDLVIVRQDDFAAGWAIVQSIEVAQSTKRTKRCPSCKQTDLSFRTRKLPAVKCSNCLLEFSEEEVFLTIDPVTKFCAVYRDTWHDAARPVHYSRISEFQLNNNKINSIRELDSARIQVLLNEIDGPNFDIHALYTPQDLQLIVGGHDEVIVKRRRGQRQFRFEMMQKYGEVCAMSGMQPPQVLEAAHLYSYASVGTHRTDGGLLLRRDLHSLFDKFFLTVDPTTWKVKADPYLKSFETYRNLDGRSILVGAETRPSESLMGDHFELASRAMFARSV